jgi:hypothetical protein
MRVSLEVDLFKRNQLLGRALTKDISLGGMMLQSKAPVLHRNDLIVMHLWVNGVEQNMHGLVIHTTNDIAGIMLIDMNRETSRTYIEFLKEMEVPLKSALGTFEKSHTE